MVKGTEKNNLKYKLTNIQLQFEMIQSQELSEEAKSVYTSGKGFVYDHVIRDKVVLIDKGTDTTMNVKVNSQRSSTKGLLLLFVELYTAGKRDSEKYVFSDINNNGIEGQDIWEEVSRFFMKEKHRI